MKSLKHYTLAVLILCLCSIIGCQSGDVGVSCGSNENFEQQEFKLNLAGIGDFSFSNYAAFECFSQDYLADTYGRSNYDINGFKYYTRKSKFEIPLEGQATIVIEFEKAFLNGQEDPNDKNWHARETLEADFVFGIDGNYVNNPPYTAATALLWANYPTIASIQYTDQAGNAWFSTDTEQFQSADFRITNIQELDYSPVNAPTTQYDFNVIATGNITCTLKARGHNGDNIQLVEAPFVLPFHLIQ